MSPKATYGGMGLAEGIVLASVMTGLFVLMKNVWGMRNVWIAVLIPVLFQALLLMYLMQGLRTHDRFSGW